MIQLEQMKGLIQMKKALPLGIMDFSELRVNNYLFVDKTLMIKDYLDRKNKVTLITRPRRFGKTLNMSMMSEFFDITKDSTKIFKDTKIMETDYAKEMNQWPSIFISFADMKGKQVTVVKSIKQMILNIYLEYSFLFQNLKEDDEVIYQDIRHNLRNFYDGDLENIANSIAYLMSKMEKYYHKKVMVFIDEYDTPFIEAHVNNYYSEIKSGLSMLLHNTLKSSTSLQYAMLTGIQRVAKENIFSDLNNLVVCTVKDEEYSQYFGFTEKETDELLKEYDLELNQDVKNMYNGYHFGNINIYNPWSIINYAQRKKMESYWINTSSNNMIKNSLKKVDSSFGEQYEELISQGYLDTFVLLETSFYEEAEIGSLWGLFINAGYLTIDKQIRNNYYRLVIPNEEVQNEFKSLTAYYLNAKDTDFENLYNAFETANEKLFTTTYTNILETLPSSFDLKDENSYHMMVLGLCAWMRNIYEVESNREEGLGRGDIVLIAKRNDIPSYVLEFKYSKEECDLNKLANDAIQQIIDKKYDMKLKGKIIYIGLAHHKKSVKVKWINKN